MEKEKLLLVAAQHLDVMHLSIPSEVTLTMGNLTLTSTDANKKYSNEKIVEIKEKITESLDNFQSLKCDYLDL